MFFFQLVYKVETVTNFKLMTLNYKQLSCQSGCVDIYLQSFSLKTFIAQTVFQTHAQAICASCKAIRSTIQVTKKVNQILEQRKDRDKLCQSNLTLYKSRQVCMSKQLANYTNNLINV